MRAVVKKVVLDAVHLHLQQQQQVMRNLLRNAFDATAFAMSNPLHRRCITPFARIGIDAGIIDASLFCPDTVGLVERLRLGLARQCELADFICRVRSNFGGWSHDVFPERDHRARSMRGLYTHTALQARDFHSDV